MTTGQYVRVFFVESIFIDYLVRTSRRTVFHQYSILLQSAPAPSFPARAVKFKLHWMRNCLSDSALANFTECAPRLSFKLG